MVSKCKKVEWDYLWRSEGVEEWVHGEEHLGDGYEVWNMAVGKGIKSRVVLYM